VRASGTGPLTAKQTAALELLGHLSAGPSSGYVLGVGLGVSTAGAHATCASLVRRGLATRGPDGRLGRMSYTITDAGRAELGRIHAAAQS
jgi:DNA-binding IclR family transcriptional regulator